MRRLLLVLPAVAVCSLLAVACDDASGGAGGGDDGGPGGGSGGSGGSGGAGGTGGSGGDPCAGVACDPGFSCDPATGACTCGGQTCAQGQACEDGACVDPLPDRCTGGSSWAPGTAAFREVDWGLGAMGVAGVRIGVADFDDDGLTDLSVRATSNTGNDYAEGGARTSWLLRNEGGGAFADVTQSSGIDAPRTRATPRPGQVVVWGDVDNDGDLDAFVGLSTAANPADEESSELLLNDGTGHFGLGPADTEVRRPGQRVEISGASFVDYDRDGLLDLFVGSGPGNLSPGQDHLYRGLGIGYYEDVTTYVGLETEPWNDVTTLNEGRAHAINWGTAACDLNGDGTPELLASSYGRAPNHLFQGDRAADGTVTFRNRSVDSGYAYDDRMDWSDNESARCWCQLHPDDEGCAGVPPPQYIRCANDGDAFRWRHDTDREPLRLGGNSGTTTCADVDNDGDLDLLTSEIVHWDVGSSSDPAELLLNDGAADVRFDRPGNEATGLVKDHGACLGWNDGDITNAVLDFDNDGRPDVYMATSDYPGTRGHLYRQLEDGTFAELPLAEGIDQMSSHGVGVADFDRDGDLDLVLGHSFFRCGQAGGGCFEHCYDTNVVRSFENLLGQDGNWVQLDLRGGEGTNRLAIGARVSVTAGGVTQTQEIEGGHGHYGVQTDRVLHFGLGEACEATVTVRWPDEALTTETFTVKTGYRWRLEQGGRATAER